LKDREGQWSLETGKVGGGGGVRRNGYQIHLGGNSSSDLYHRRKHSLKDYFAYFKITGEECKHSSN
jgi:hypothetical protein